MVHGLLDRQKRPTVSSCLIFIFIVIIACCGAKSECFRRLLGRCCNRQKNDRQSTSSRFRSAEQLAISTGNCDIDGVRYNRDGRFMPCTYPQHTVPDSTVQHLLNLSPEQCQKELRSICLFENDFMNIDIHNHQQNTNTNTNTCNTKTYI